MAALLGADLDKAQTIAGAAVDAFRGRAGRLVAVSSGDVYAAYGALIGTEPARAEAHPVLLAEGAPTWCLEQDEVREAYFGKRTDAARIATLRRARRGPGGS